MTEGHPVMTERGWVRAGNLHAADKIITAEGRKETLQGLFLLIMVTRYIILSWMVRNTN